MSKKEKELRQNIINLYKDLIDTEIERILNELTLRTNNDENRMLSIKVLEEVLSSLKKLPSRIKSDSYLELQDLIKKKRLELGFKSKQKLADAMGVYPKLISRAENKGEPTKLSKKLIRKVIDFLFKEENEHKQAMELLEKSD